MATDFKLAHHSKIHQPSFSQPAVLEVHPGKLELTVLFTGLPATLHALSKANELARGLNASIRLIVAQVVPYGLPLEEPPVKVAFHERNLQAIGKTQTTEMRAEIFLCRDVDLLLGEILPQHSTVIMGGRMRWWPTPEELLARRLRRQGHEVIFEEPIEKDKHHA